MALDPSIPLGGQMPKFANPMEVYAGAMQLRQQREASEAMAEQRRAIAEQRRVQTAAAQREAAEADALRQLFSGTEPPKPSQIYAIVGPQRGTEIWKGLRAIQSAEVKDYGELQKVIGTTLGGLNALPEAMRPEAYQTIRGAFVQKGWLNPAEIPEEYNPEFMSMAQQWAMTPKEQWEAQNPKPPALIQRDPSKPMVNPQTGETVVEADPAAMQADLSRSDLRIQAAEALRRGDTAEYQRLIKAAKDIGDAGRAPAANININAGTGGPQGVDTPLDPDSQDIMSQAGLSYNGFLAITGRMSQLPRDKETRNRASAEVASWARSRGMDVATLASQYKAYNEALENNIQRYNRTLLAEGEIAASVSNLATSAKQSGLGDVRAINAAKQWLKGELNDPNAAEYAFFLNQLVNDIALYNASSQGRAALQTDVEDAKSVVSRGIATGSLTGMQRAITASVEKMGTVLEGAVNRSRKNVWDLFGVGDKYKAASKGNVGAAGDGTVQMRTPDGRVVSVPADKVDEAIKRGATKVGG